MKELSNLFLIIILIVIIKLLTSCNTSFSSDELKFAKPFTNKNIVEFRSSRGQIDTVIFYPAVIDTFSSVEQGLYNENILRIAYELTDNSYHRLISKSVNEEPEYFISFSKEKASSSSKEISFLGLLFSNDYINKVINKKDSLIVFSQGNAKYKDVNINEGIKSFNFNFKKGILSFIDKNDIEWVRLN